MENNEQLFSDNQFFVSSDISCFREKSMLKVEYIMILFCRRGWMDVVIDLKNYRISANTRFFLFPGTVFTLSMCSDDNEVFCFVSSWAFCREVFMRMEPAFFRFMKEEPCRLLDIKELASMHIFMDSVSMVFSDRENKYRLQIARNCLQNFLFDVYDKGRNRISETPLLHAGRKDDTFHRFMVLVRRFCVSHRQVEFYAEKLCISAKYLSDISRGEVGVSAKQVIDNFVVLEIKSMLLRTGVSMQDIADRLGFPDQSYLGRYFKRHEGLSPREFRRRYMWE